MRWAVIVNGPPGSGKSTTAHRLAAVLRLPVFSKDAVKETLLDELGYASREDSRAIGAASGEVVWTLLRDCPAPAIVESWLAPHTRDIVRAGLRRAAVERVIEVWCSGPLNLWGLAKSSEWRPTGTWTQWAWRGLFWLPPVWNRCSSPRCRGLGMCSPSSP